MLVLSACDSSTKLLETTTTSFIPVETQISTTTPTTEPTRKLTFTPTFTSTATSTPAPIDEDNDGLLESQEQEYDTSDQLVDTDGDGLDDNVEITKYLTDPTLIDTDADGINDDVLLERQEHADAIEVRVWARFMGDVNQMNSLYQDVQEVIYDDGILLKVSLSLFPHVQPIMDASIFDANSDTSELMGQYPQSVLSSMTKEEIAVIAGLGSPSERAQRIIEWFRKEVMNNRPLSQGALDGWRRKKSDSVVGEYEPGEFIFRELKSGAQFSDPYTGNDDNFKYYTLGVNGEVQITEMPKANDPEWEFIHRFWYWRLWPVEMQYRAKRTGDCGPTAVFLASVFQSIGIPARIVFETSSTDEMLQHFYPEIFINGYWIAADPRNPLGQRPKDHWNWVQWNRFDGAWLLEADNYTQWAFRQGGITNHGSLDQGSIIPNNYYPPIVYPDDFR